MAYEVPKFIDIENKVIGPLTGRQFLYLLVAAVIDVILYQFISFFIWIFIAGIVSLLGLAFAFYKPNGIKFERFFLAVLNWFLTGKYFFWQKKEKKKEVVINMDIQTIKNSEFSSEASEETSKNKKVYDFREIAKILDKK